MSRPAVVRVGSRCARAMVTRTPTTGVYHPPIIVAVAVAVICNRNFLSAIFPSYIFSHPPIYFEVYYYVLKAKNGLGRFAPSSLPHYKWAFFCTLAFFSLPVAGLISCSRLRGTQGAPRTPPRKCGPRPRSVSRALGVQSRK